MNKIQCYNKTHNNMGAGVKVATGKYIYVSVNASLAQGRKYPQAACSFQQQFIYSK